MPEKKKVASENKELKRSNSDKRSSKELSKNTSYKNRKLKNRKEGSSYNKKIRDNNKISDNKIRKKKKTSADNHHKATHNKATHNKEKAKQKKNIRRNFMLFSILIIMGVAALAIAYDSLIPLHSNKDRLPVTLYVMSKCPYGIQAENEIKPVLDKLSDSVDFDLQFIAQSVEKGFLSLHGKPEIRGNLIQLCAKKYYPLSFMDLVVCMNEDASSIPDNWKACASKNEMNIDKLEKCMNSEDGKELLIGSIKESQKANAKSSPTIMINNKIYNGDRSQISLMREICKYVDDDACLSISECNKDSDCEPKQDKIAICVRPNRDDSRCSYTDPVFFDVIVLNDKGCDSECDTAKVINANEKLFKGVNHRFVDISSPEGKKLVRDLGIDTVPAYLFEMKVTQTRPWKLYEQIRPAFEQKGEFLKLRDNAVGASKKIR